MVPEGIAIICFITLKISGTPSYSIATQVGETLFPFFRRLCLE
jgi:hypothetical protein